MGKNKLLIAPSILAASSMGLEDAAKAAQDAGADMLHVDVMDGKFVARTVSGPLEVRQIRKAVSLFLDVHLMVSHPLGVLAEYAEAGANRISVHVEGTADERELLSTLEAIKGLGIEAGLAVNPPTYFSRIPERALAACTALLVMTVNPGASGQAFIPDMLPKIRQAREWLDAHGKAGTAIEVDGGVNPSTIGKCVEAGASVFVAGASFYKASNRREAMRQLREAATAASADAGKGNAD